MTKFYDVKRWIFARNPREQVFILFAVLAMIYFLWDILIDKPLLRKHKELIANMNSTFTAVNDINAKIVSIETVIQNIKSQFPHENILSSLQSKDFQKDIDSLMKTSVSVDQLPSIMKEILDQHGEVNIIGLKQLPSELWITDQDLLPKLSPTVKNIKQYNFQLEFQGKYFDTLAYLSELEKLSTRLYWTNLEYKVTEYPEANVMVKFYLLA